jgi:hypothetical protein
MNIFQLHPGLAGLASTVTRRADRSAAQGGAAAFDHVQEDVAEGRGSRVCRMGTRMTPRERRHLAGAL